MSQRGGPAQDPAGPRAHADAGLARRLRGHGQRARRCATRSASRPLLERAYLENVDAQPAASRSRSCRRCCRWPGRCTGRQGRRLPARLPAVGRPHLPGADRPDRGPRRPTRPAPGSGAEDDHDQTRSSSTRSPASRATRRSRSTSTTPARCATRSSTSPSSAASSGSCQGRPLHEMPSLMARICGICPVSHLIASAKACDEILAVEPPPTGADLRRVMNLAQIVQSHALSFFHLSSPDLLFGFDADPAKRNIFGVAAGQPAAGPRRHRACASSASRSSSGWAASGSTRRGSCPAASTRRSPRRRATGSCRRSPRRSPRSSGRSPGTSRRSLRWEDEAASFGNFRSAFMGLVDEDGNVDYYDGRLRVMDADGTSPRRSHRPARLPGLPRRGGRALVVPEVDLLEGARLSRRHVPGRPAGARHRGRPDGHAARRPGAGRVPATARARARAARSTTTTPG